MASKHTIFRLLFVLSAIKLTLGLTMESYAHEMLEEYEEISFNRVRRDTHGQESTKKPGVETEQRPPATTRAPTVAQSTLPPLLKQTTERTVKRSTTKATPITTLSANTSISNNTVNDTHKYYKSSYDSSGASTWWYPLEKSEAVIHKRLSKNIQYSDTIRTLFQFPFYGHIINYVTITNRGYLFLGDVVHKFNASSQYVAPLMADFKTNNDTMIVYQDTGDRFTVQWTNLTFQDRKVGQFSFQCTLLKNGTIIFAYRNIPAPVKELKSVALKQRVGISDSLRYRILRHGLFFINGKFYTTLAQNIYFKYHSVDLPMDNVKTGAAYIITPLPNCVMLKSCNACVSTQTSFKCVWCPQLQRCSDGVDRHRQQWFAYKCQRNNQTTCPAEPSTTPSATTQPNQNHSTEQASKKLTTVKVTTSSWVTSTGTVLTSIIKTPTKIPTKIKTPTAEAKHTYTTPTEKTLKKETDTFLTKPTKRNQSNWQNTKNGILNNKGKQAASKSGSRSSALSGVGIGLIVLSLVIILAAFCWLVYAYQHPQSKSGRFLIEHRNPKKWFKSSDDTSSGRMHYKTKSMELTES